MKPYTDAYNEPIAEMEQFVRKKKPKSPKPPKSPEASKSPNNSPDGETGSPDENMMRQCKEMMHQKHHEKVVQACFTLVYYAIFEKSFGWKGFSLKILTWKIHFLNILKETRKTRGCMANDQRNNRAKNWKRR